MVYQLRTLTREGESGACKLPCVSGSNDVEVVVATAVVNVVVVFETCSKVLLLSVLLLLLVKYLFFNMPVVDAIVVPPMAVPAFRYSFLVTVIVCRFLLSLSLILAPTPMTKQSPLKLALSTRFDSDLLLTPPPATALFLLTSS